MTTTTTPSRPSRSRPSPRQLRAIDMAGTKCSTDPRSTAETTSTDFPTPASEIDKWDSESVRQFKDRVRPLVSKYFRSEVRDVARLQATGAALVVSNHSGGTLTPDVLVFGSAFYDAFGFDRPLYTLAHSQIFLPRLNEWFPRVGVIHASRDNAAQALRAGGVVLVFPGGDYDAYRPTTRESVIDFNGRTGYIHTAINAGVPIVPVVSIGAQQSQLFLTRGTTLAKRLGLKRFRVEILPISIGFPFGLSIFVPPNLPLPTKVVTQVLEPIDIVARFGDHPDIGQVDAYVRSVMQTALAALGRERRFPVIG